jgi:hypothetical protein
MTIYTAKVILNVGVNNGNQTAENPLKQIRYKSDSGDLSRHFQRKRVAILITHRNLGEKKVILQNAPILFSH